MTDTDSKIISSLISAIFGSVLGYSFGWLKDSIDKKRRRKSLATALLIEIAWSERPLRDLAEKQEYSSKNAVFPLSIHDKIFQDILLFDPQTVHHLLNFYETVVELRTTLDKLLTSDEKSAKEIWFIQNRAIYACNRIFAAKRALEKEGGKLPGMNVDEVLDEGDLPILKEEQFPIVKIEKKKISNNQG